MAVKMAKVLIADDNADARELIARVMSSYEIDFALTADEEIVKAKQNQYFLILTDNNMEDGYENSGLYAIEQIRKFNKKVPIFFLTSALTDDLRNLAQKKGANEAMEKLDFIKNKVKVKNMAEQYISRYRQI